MDAKYIQALKAGIIGGILVAACIMVNLIIDIISSRMNSVGTLGMATCCVWIIMVIIMAGTGALAVYYARTLIAKLEDAIILGGLAGAIMGIIATVMQIVVAVLRPWLVTSYVSEYYSSLFPDLYQYSQYGGLGSNLGQSVSGVIGGICCCGPAFIVIGVVLAAIGAAIYASMKLKLS